MMMFRRLYWVAEEVEKSGPSKVTGVYTSIQDLIHHGLHWCNGAPGALRLTLVKPDSFNSPIGVFESPSFKGLHETLSELVTGSEVTNEELITLEAALNDFAGATAKA